MFDIVALGEILIDFTPYGLSEVDNTLFERNPGGAPANVLFSMARLGAKPAFIGKVGNDQFGDFLKKCLLQNNIDIQGLKRSTKANTTLAFVHLSKTGDRSFSFYRNPGADMMLKESDIDEHIIKNSRIFHFGSISMTDEPARSATIRALNFAKENNVLISYDPNLRPLLWNSLNEARKQIIAVLPYINILKVSEEELEFITCEKQLEKGSRLLSEKGVDCILVTLGSRGAFYRIGELFGRLQGYDVAVIDTTGAGDAFLGGILYTLKGMNTSEILHLSQIEIEQIVDFGNAVGALTTTKKGAIPAVPTMEEVKQCMKTVCKLQ